MLRRVVPATREMTLPPQRECAAPAQEREITMNTSVTRGVRTAVVAACTAATVLTLAACGDDAVEGDDTVEGYDIAADYCGPSLDSNVRQYINQAADWMADKNDGLEDIGITDRIALPVDDDPRYWTADSLCPMTTGHMSGNLQTGLHASAHGLPALPRADAIDSDGDHVLSVEEMERSVGTADDVLFTVLIHTLADRGRNVEVHGAPLSWPVNRTPGLSISGYLRDKVERAADSPTTPAPAPTRTTPSPAPAAPEPAPDTYRSLAYTADGTYAWGHGATNNEAREAALSLLDDPGSAGWSVAPADQCIVVAYDPIDDVYQAGGRAHDQGRVQPGVHQRVQEREHALGTDAALPLLL